MITACWVIWLISQDRWSECRFRKLVEVGLDVEPSKDDYEPAERKKDNMQGRRRRGTRRSGR